MMIIKAVIFINLFALFLSLVILLLDRIISNYGTCTLTINYDKQITGKGGKTLLRILFENKYFIPSACGGKGTCGYCRVWVLDEGIPVAPSETLVFTKKELRDHYYRYQENRDQVPFSGNDRFQARPVRAGKGGIGGRNGLPGLFHGFGSREE